MASERKAKRATPEWQHRRRAILGEIERMSRGGYCYLCHDLKTKEVFGQQPTVFEDDLFRVVLDPYPRVKGHAIIVYKPHREDISALREDECALVMEMCTAMIKAIKAALGAEKVYMLTMCDGRINHLNFQLFPRYAGDVMGHRLFMQNRRPLTQGGQTAALIRAAFFQQFDVQDTT
ncbi:MAG: HIT family protein [Planctomycetota bacterium]|jgi:diadenosine tetraphosphate (Ap4A) HIT family hydrolase